MLDLEYVKRKRRKKLVAIFTSAATMVIAVLIIIAFLGQTLGSFTVSTNGAESMKLALSEHSDMSRSSTYLRISKIPKMDVYTYSLIKKKTADIDSDKHDYMYGAKTDKKSGLVKYLYFFNYTFYLQNTGSKECKYTLDINVVDNEKPKNVDYDLLDILRVGFFENEDDTHDCTIYAKKSRTGHKDEESAGGYSYQEAVSGEAGTEEFYGYAEEFLSDECLVSHEVTDFKPGDMRRYTILTWLEGEDLQAAGTVPSNCSIKLGVEISAYENEE